MRTIPLNITVAILLCASFAMAQTTKPVTLKVGDTPPPLAGTKWMQGEPVTGFEKGTIYVIEMWATWCGPCIAAVPHLNQIQASYGKDEVIVIGQNIWEADPSDVAPFLKSMADPMTYRVVMDDVSGRGRGKMAETWMDAAGKDGIPCTFVIGKDGTIAWIGHPMVMEPVLKQIIAGTYDPQKAATELAALPQVSAPKPKVLINPTPAQRDQTDIIRFGTLLEDGDYAAAYTLGADLAVRFNDDAGKLNTLAWTIAVEPGLQRRDLDLAEKMAARGVELSQRNNVAILDTLARVHFEKGQIDQAILVQTEAVNKAGEKSRVQETLDKYKLAKEQKRGHHSRPL